MLGLVQEILPALSALINQVFPPPPKSEAGEVTNGGTTSQHYAILESDHPYKPATVANYKVSLFKKKSNSTAYYSIKNCLLQ